MYDIAEVDRPEVMMSVYDILGVEGEMVDADSRAEEAFGEAIRKWLDSERRRSDFKLARSMTVLFCVTSRISSAFTKANINKSRHSEAEDRLAELSSICMKAHFQRMSDEEGQVS